MAIKPTKPWVTLNVVQADKQLVPTFPTNLSPLSRRDIGKTYEDWISKAIAPLKGQRLNQQTVQILKHTIQRAALEVFREIPEWYKHVYQLESPELESIDIVVNGPELTIQWKKPLVPEDLGTGEDDYSSGGC
jgi:hypothetical protein